MTPLDLLPDLVAHADWGSNTKKRWMARAVLKGGTYTAMPAELAGPPATLLARLREAAAASGRVFLGFDFPIGLPAFYARRTGVSDFPAFLLQAGLGEWGDFYQVAARAEEVSRRRPFYPMRSRAKGEISQQHLLDGLGASSLRELLRACERGTDLRPDASPLFWTLGGKQVGKAAIIGWRDVLAPALLERANRVALWPFHGPLSGLLKAGGVVVAETYPAEFYSHLGVSFPPSRAGEKSGKRIRRDRLANKDALKEVAAHLGVVLDGALAAQINDGFGQSKDGEDPFDAVVGLLGMLNVVLGGQPTGVPDLPDVRSVEGWILGQSFVPATESP